MSGEDNPPADSCEARAEAALERLVRQRSLNALLSLNPHILAQARRADVQQRQGVGGGPLHGLLLVVKDNIDCAGLPTSVGCRALASTLPRQDAPVIARLKAAGALILGKSNLSEFAFDVRSRSSLGGDVCNPHNPALTAGGSSGGSAAAVAAGLAEAALGSDTGGSIRIPCAYNGLVGLRPSHSRALLAGVVPLSMSKDTVGPMTHTVAEAARLWWAMSGQPQQTLTDLPLREVRLGVLTPLLGDDPRQLPLLDQRLAQLSRQGVQLIPLAPPLLAAVAAQGCLSQWEFRHGFDRWLATTHGGPASLAEVVASGDYLAEFAPLLQQHLACRSLKVPGWYQLRRFHRQLRQQLQALMVQHRLTALIYPTVQRLPVSLAKMPPGCAPELAAMSGWPALTLPAGRSPDGFPIGMELLMPARQEARLLALGRQLERAQTVER